MVSSLCLKLVLALEEKPYALETDRDGQLVPPPDFDEKPPIERGKEDGAIQTRA